MPNKINYLGNPQYFPKAEEILCSRQFVVEEFLELPCNKPDMEKLSDVKASVEVVSYQFINSPQGWKVFIRGVLKQEILYIADAPCQPVHAFTFCSSFSTFMNLPCACISNYSALEMHKPKILVEFLELNKICARSIFKAALLFLWYPTGLIIPRKPQTIFIPIPKTSCQVVCKPVRKIYKHRHHLEE